jgi:transcriptional regulator with XRE-family HTH domain
MNTTMHVPFGQRLVAERMRRRWTQLEVADLLGTTPGNVSRWERDITSPGPYFRRKLCELFGRSAQELGLTWDASDDSLGHYPQTSDRAASFQRGAPLSHPTYTDREDLLALLGTMIRSDTTEALSSVTANSRTDGLNLLEQENGDQVRLAQAIEEWLQTGLNRVLIPANSGAVVLVVLNSNVCSRPSFQPKRLCNRPLTRREECCDEYPAMQGTLRQRQGA